MVFGIGVDMVTISEIARFLPEGGLAAVAGEPTSCAPAAPAVAGEPPSCAPGAPDVAVPRAPSRRHLDAFVRRTFTEAELAQAALRHDQASYLAGRFAAKEAVFKALAQRTATGFDLRIVETIDDEAGAPHVSTHGPLAAVLAEVGATEVLVSITNEGDCTVAFALAQ